MTQSIIALIVADELKRRRELDRLFQDIKQQSISAYSRKRVKIFIMQELGRPLPNPAKLKLHATSLLEVRKPVQADIEWINEFIPHQYIPEEFRHLFKDL